MSNDPFFEAWVRDRLKEAETRTPEHLWNSIRKRHTYYILMERTKYACFVALLLAVTGGVGYWGFHQEVTKSAAARNHSATRNDGSIAAATPQRAPTVMASGNTTFRIPAMGGRVTAANLMGVDNNTAVSNTAVSNRAVSGAAGSDPAAQAFADLSSSPASADLSVRVSTANPLEALAAGLNILARSSLTPPLALKHRGAILIEGYGGPDHDARYLRASNQRYIPYVSSSKHTITPYPSFSMGFHVNIPLSGNWSFRTGINYSQINEVFNYQNADDKRVVTDLTNRQVITTSGTTVTVVDTSRFAINGKLVKRSLNANRIVDLPLLVSYSLPRMGRVQVSGSTGAMVNLASWYMGDILDTTGTPIALTTKENHGVASWKKYIGAAWYGSVILRTQVAPRLQATVEPYLRYDLSPVNQDVSVFRQRYVTTGMMAGLAYRLGR